MNKISLKELIRQLLEKEHLLSAPDLLTSLEKNGHTYNKTSVYRALEQLLDEEIICRHHFSNSQASYELRDHHHTHLVCTKCGEIQAEECGYINPQTKGSFLVNHCHTTLFGLCQKCQ